MLSAAQGVFGQGGPPMITDDPGTPGNGKWENNFAFVFEHRAGETSFETPQLDLNYGVGEHVQLTLQTRPVILDRSGQGLIGGLGGTEAAVKWRYADEEKTGVDASLFPRVIFNVQESSGRRGLSEKGTRFQVPFEVAKSFGRWHADAEFGPLISTVGRSEWLYGVVGGFDLTKTTGLMAEVHADSRTNFTEPTVVLNFGLRHQLSENRILIISMGHEVHTPRDPLALIGYFGAQFLY
jgi:hypothetical protein